MVSVLGATIGGFLMPSAQAADQAGITQRPAGWPFASTRAIEPEIARVFGCTLQQTPRVSQCLSSRTHGLVSIDIDPMHGEAIKFTAMALVSHDDVPKPEEERVSIEAVMQLVDYLFPDWAEGRTWMSLALQQARDRHADSRIILGNAILTIEHEIPLGVPEQSTFAFITVERAISSSGIDNRFGASP